MASGELRVSRRAPRHQLLRLRDRFTQRQQRVPGTNFCELRLRTANMHVGFTVTSPPAHRGLYGCAPVAFASEESSPPGITTAQLVEADELYLN